MESSIRFAIIKRYESTLKRSLLAFSIALLVSGTLYAQGVILRGRKYIVTDSNVVQGSNVAMAVSPEQLETTYRSNYHFTTPRDIQIKFSINGADNEAPPGQNHLLVINSDGSAAESHTYVFGKFSPVSSGRQAAATSGFLSRDTKVVIRLDMRNVIAGMKKNGYYVTFDGRKISETDFKGVYVAGNTLPLSWDFQALPEKPQFALHDSDGTGIYKVTLLFKKEQYPGETGKRFRMWTLTKDISAYPVYHSGSVLSEALYNKSLEEMLEDVRPDGAFMAGAMWPGVWTRDISYSGFLSLAIINPGAVKASLIKKVKDDRIIQDTGTGGSWPVSSDRMVWTLAAWEVYKVSGDTTWLRKAYNIVRNSATDDLNTLVDSRTGLFHGESSFLDWREQTYPRWMDPKDIFESEDLGTNAVQYETYVILAKMAKVLGEPARLFGKTASRIKRGINKYLWLDGKGYYGQYLYGNNFQSLSPRSESLGESLCVLFGIADPSRAAEIIRNTPVTQFGIPCIYPEIPRIPPYHNNAVWPFVESYWAWASATSGNMTSVSRAIAAVYRAAAFFLTNKENMVASTGDYLGTQINSDRQLWSVAGDLSLVYRVLFGMRFHQNSLAFAPCIPKAFGTEMSLSNFKYRKSVLSVSVKGYGDEVDRVTLDGKLVSGNSIPADLSGSHVITIVMKNRVPGTQRVNLLPVAFSPDTPQAKVAGRNLEWKPVSGAASYSVYRNGRSVAKEQGRSYPIPDIHGYSAYQVMAISGDGCESFLSKPLPVRADDQVVTVQAERGAEKVESEYTGYTGTGYIKLDLQNPDSPEYSFKVTRSGEYAVEVRYANGSGPVNTSNKCALRTLKIDQRIAGPIVMPQRGAGNWEDWGYSNSVKVFLHKGSHVLAITFNKHDNNMNGKTNTALVDAVRITMISMR